jgi:choline dehydrogenase-like flavoprotein
MIEALCPRPLNYDLCIIGAGPAGLTIATQLAYCGLDLCVLESGDTSLSQFADQLKEVEFDALPIKSTSRERVVGGTSATWDGRSAPLDEIDFEPRDWPTWPISRDELLRYLAEAVQYRFPCLSDFEVQSQVSRDASCGPWLNLAIKMFVAVKPPYRFNSLQSVFQRTHLDLWTRATLSRLKSKPAGDGGRTVTAAVCRTVSGDEVEVCAKYFVLAAGGIENARILLSSDAALGNEQDQVGRYFMNHPKGEAGLLDLARPLARTSPLLDQAFGSKAKYAGLRLAPEIQRTRGLLNSYVRFEPHTHDGGDLRARIDRLRTRAKDSDWTRRFGRIVSDRWTSVAPPVRALRSRWFLEMEPRSTNRITLADRTDALGNRLAHVHCELSERDRATLVTLHGIVQENIARLHLGRFESSAAEALAAATADASHHLGSTRMGLNPKTSVVDADCKVHTVTNLYVAGGSVFSSGGCANPTFTIAALAIRLARHLQRVATPAATSVSQTPIRGAAAGFLLIGAGHRVSEDVVPSLESHDDRFEVVGIYTRTPASVFGPRRRYDVQPVTSLRDDMLGDARFIYVGVSREAVVPVLKVLRRWSSRELILDTPVPTSRRAVSILRRFKRVHVAEDSPYLPWLEAVRGFWAATGLTGPVDINFDRSAYHYHGVALAKALCGTDDTPATVVASERKAGIFSIRLNNGTARITEPRDYAVGTLSVTRGGVTISSHAADRVVPIKILSENGLCVGFDVGGATALLSRPESLLVGKIAANDSIVSRMGALKRVGLARMFAMMADNKEPWPLARGLDDARVDQV